MKKNALATLLLVGVVQMAQAGLPTGATLYDVNVPSLWGGAFLGLTALHWETSVPHYDYALTYPPDDSGIPREEEGLYHSLNPDSRWNFQLTVGYIFPCSGNDLTFNYISYDQWTNDSVTTDPFTALILPTLSNEWPVTGSVTIDSLFLDIDPTLFITANPNLITARTTINLNVFDLNYGQSFNLGSQTRIKYYIGLRYANLENEINVINNFSQVNTTPIEIVSPTSDLGIIVNTSADFTETVDQKSYFNGLGPQLGVDAHYYLCWGFGLVGNLSTSLLIGEINSSLNETLTTKTKATVVGTEIDGIPIGTTFSDFDAKSSDFRHPHERRIVPNIDSRIGIDYTYQYCNHTKLNIELGYRVSHYFDSVDRLSEVGVDHPDRSTRHTLDTNFEGIYLGIQVKI